MVAAKFRFAKKSVALNARDARYKLRVYTLRVGAMAEARQRVVTISATRPDAHPARRTATFVKPSRNFTDSLLPCLGFLSGLVAQNVAGPQAEKPVNGEASNRNKHLMRPRSLFR